MGTSTYCFLRWSLYSSESFVWIYPETEQRYCFPLSGVSELVLLTLRHERRVKIAFWMKLTLFSTLQKKSISRGSKDQNGLTKFSKEVGKKFHQSCSAAFVPLKSCTRAWPLLKIIILCFPFLHRKRHYIFCALHLWVFFLALTTDPLECSQWVWCRKDGEGFSGMLHDVNFQMVWWSQERKARQRPNLAQFFINILLKNDVGDIFISVSFPCLDFFDFLLPFLCKKEPARFRKHDILRIWAISWKRNKISLHGRAQRSVCADAAISKKVQ